MLLHSRATPSSSKKLKQIPRIPQANYYQDLLGKQLNHQRHVNFVMKKAAKMVNKHNHLYLLNSTMRDELIFISHALLLESGIKFETLIAHLMIPVLAQTTNLVKKHKDLINILHWVKEDCNSPDLV